MMHGIHKAVAFQFPCVAVLALHHRVPGDRLWFRNPDERSSDVRGYEGSWVIDMGRGLFSNFWQRDQPCTLEAKAIGIDHWRGVSPQHCELVLPAYPGLR